MSKKRYFAAVLDEPLSITDPLTGEVREAARLIIPYGNKDKDFCKVYHHTINKLTSLPRSCQALFDWLLEKMDFENKVYIYNQKSLSKALGFAHGTIRNAFSLLQKRGYIRKLGGSLYMVNPSLACKTASGKDLYIQFIKNKEFEAFEALEVVKNEK